MKTTRLFLFCVLSFSLSISSFGQQKGAFTDVYVKRILFPDIPNQVKTYIDSQGIFIPVKRVLFQTFDLNGFPSNGTSYTYINSFSGNDTVKTIISSSQTGKVLILNNRLKYSTGEEDFTREVIEYNNLNLAIKVNIDTSLGGTNYGSKYQYLYTYDNAGRVDKADIYNRTSKGFYISQGTSFTYNSLNKPASLITINYDVNGNITSNQSGKFFYQNEKLDSLVVRNVATNNISGKFIAFYKNNKIFKTDTYQDFFGSLSFTGSTWYYENNILALEENEVLKSMKIINPVQQNLIFLNAPEKPFDLIDNSGNIVLKGQTTTNIEVSSLKPGFYVVKIKGDYAIHTIKIVKE